MKYQKTILVSSILGFSHIKCGQWIQLETGPRGQYLGTTASGSQVVRWQNGTFKTKDAKANAPLRHFAKIYG
jgi:hypothetical protein